jgi:pimeloyl-ACP methyl ester carboxylesterase/class 3 adenylate cyclase
MMPTTRYAKAGDVNIAFQTTGRSEPDLVFVPGWVSHIEYAWEEPSFAPFLARLASFSRLILLDRRGTGLSDPVTDLPTLEERMEDILAVMDAAGSQRAFLFGISESGPMCELFAATFPERTAGLILCNSFARLVTGDDYPWGHDPARWDVWRTQIDQEWGSGWTPRRFAPSRANDDAFVESWATFERRAVSKGAVTKLLSMIWDTDARHVLPSIRVPTLVIHRTGDRPIPVEVGRYLAEHIPAAQYLELPGEDHFPWVGDSDAILTAAQGFVLGSTMPLETDRALATVVFLDIVGSTRRLTALGDRRWRELLQRFYRLVRAELVRFRGREIDTAGDGMFATFDGPARAIRCACTMRDRVAALGIEIRSGLHTGECELLGEKVSGIAVHIGARICGLAAPGEVLVSRTVKDLVAGAGLRFDTRGVHTLKGVTDQWELFAAVG